MMKDDALLIGAALKAFADIANILTRADHGIEPESQIYSPLSTACAYGVAPVDSLCPNRAVNSG
jgi:hypothetical protein